MPAEDIVRPSPSGVFCTAGDFHIDPTAPVERAVITHAHRDHATAGHGAVLATQETLDIMRLRLGENFASSTQALAYGESVNLGGAKVTLHPAGHVLGSAQVRIETDALRIVASGDYKDVEDPTCSPFEPLACDVFITEATFGLPVFRHGDPAGEIERLLHSLTLFPERTHLVGAYPLGKAQRIIALLREADYTEPVYLHGAIAPIARYYQERGIDLGAVALARDGGELPGRIVLCPPSALKSVWTRRFAEPVIALASGFMRVRARARQNLVELPLTISDHADWDGLTRTILATGAGDIWVTHGQEDAIVHWGRTQGLRSHPLAITGYGEEDEADGAAGSGRDAP